MSKLAKGTRLKNHAGQLILVNPGQCEFARLIVEERLNQTEAARLAWPDQNCSGPKGHMAMKSVGVKLMIQHLRSKNVRLHATKLCYEALLKVVSSGTATESAIIKAASELHDKFGMGQGRDEEAHSKALEDMTSDELDEFIANAEEQIASLNTETPLEAEELPEEDGEDRGAFYQAYPHLKPD